MADISGVFPFQILKRSASVCDKGSRRRRPLSASNPATRHLSIEKAQKWPLAEVTLVFVPLGALQGPMN